MYGDDESDQWPEREQHIFDEKVERVGGVFVEPEHTQVDCNQPDAGCATDEYPEDPYSVDNRPGTVDDPTYSFGVELPNAADQHVVPEGATHQTGPEAGDEPELELGERDERDMWRRQRSLIEEDSDSPNLPVGMSEEDQGRIASAMGDDQGDGAPEDIAETSATGSPTSGEDHGGFPER